MQKESNPTKQRESNGKRNKLRLLFWIWGNFYSGKNLFKFVERIGGFETKLQALESPDSDKRAKSYTKTKIGSGITIRKSWIKSEKKKNGEQINERTFVIWI